MEILQLERVFGEIFHCIAWYFKIPTMLTFQGLYLLEKTLSLKIIKPFGLQQIPGKFPTELTPPGMSRERSQYLYAKVRPYIRPWCQDKLCPPTQAEE